MKASFIRLLMLITISCLFLYAFLEQKNRLMQLQLEIPKLEKELKLLVEENRRMSYEIERFENPKNLLELSRKPRFRHLKQPALSATEVIHVP